MSICKTAVGTILARAGHPLAQSWHRAVAMRLQDLPGEPTEADVLAAATAIHNTTEFLRLHRTSFPLLMSRWVDDRVEWTLRARHPLAGEGIPLTGDLGIDIPCTVRTQEILDAMAEANDPDLGRAELDAALAVEGDYVRGRVAASVDKLHGLVREDLNQGHRYVDAYVASLEGSLSGLCVYLYSGKAAEGDNYNPAHHVRNILKNARLAARRASVPRRPTRTDAVRA